MCDTGRFSIWLLQVVGLLGLLALCLFLALRPRSPSLAIIDFSVPPLNRSDDSGGGKVSYELQFKNPNTDSGIYYDPVMVGFFDGENELIGTRNKSGFRQKKSSTQSYDDYVDVSGGGWRNVRNAMRSGKAEVKVDVQTRVKYKTWGIESKHHPIHVSGKIPIDGSGKISSKKKEIKLKHVPSN